jgi:hypothetical protein
MAELMANPGSEIPLITKLSHSALSACIDYSRMAAKMSPIERHVYAVVEERCCGLRLTWPTPRRLMHMEAFSTHGGRYVNIKPNLTSNGRFYLQHIVALKEMISLFISNIDLFSFFLFSSYRHYIHLWYMPTALSRSIH